MSIKPLMPDFPESFLVWFGVFFFVIGLGVLGVSIFTESGSTAAGSVLMTIIGGILLVFSVLWHLYRIIRGWIALSDRRAV